MHRALNLILRFMLFLVPLTALFVLGFVTVSFVSAQLADVPEPPQVALLGPASEQPLDLRLLVESLFEEDEPTVQVIADTILNQAICQDLGRPRDDMTVAVLRISPTPSSNIRRECVHFPINDLK